MNRRDAAAVLTAPATIAAVSSKPPATVRQAELRAVIDLQNRVEVLVFGIRKRLEAGASLEPGRLGCSAVNHMSLKDLARIGIGDATQIDGYGTHTRSTNDRVGPFNKRHSPALPEAFCRC